MLPHTNTEVRNVSSHVTELSQLAVGYNDRISTLETALAEMRQKFEKFEVKAKRGPDDFLKRIVFLGLRKMSYEKRKNSMQQINHKKLIVKGVEVVNLRLQWR